MKSLPPAAAPALDLPPSSLTPWQRRILWITFIFVVGTRYYALAQSMWDWDEAQFAAAVREFSVERHHPHPPGFPMYILAAKIVRPFVPSDFHALQTVTFLAACSLFPLAFFLSRELRFPFATSYAGALLFVFLPNVWFYGGTGFSDITGVAASIAAAMLLMRGCHSPRAFLAGALVLGIAAGIRSQTLLFGFVPFLAGSWFQLRRKAWLRVIAAGLIIAVVAGASYAGAAIASDSIEGYRLSLHGVRDWVRKVDSFMNPDRPPLDTLLPRFFVRPMGAGRRLPIVISSLAAIGLLAGFVRSRRSVWLAVAIFLPFALFAWAMLDLNSIHRYSTSYIFLWALLAAHAASIFALPFGRLATFAQIAAILLVAGRAAWWTIPALREVRSTDSPPYAAMKWIRKNVSPRRPVWVHGSLAPYASYFLARRDVRMLTDERKLPRVGISDRDFYATEGVMPGAAAEFLRPRDRVWDIARRRYFETVVVQLSNVWAFREGWHDHETDGRLVWRWMGSRSEAELPSLQGPARLTLTLGAAGTSRPEVEVRLNDVVLGHFRCGEELMRREWIVAAPRADAPNRLVIVSSEVVNLAKQGISADPRDLSVQLTAYSWQQVR